MYLFSSAIVEGIVLYALISEISIGKSLTGLKPRQEGRHDTEVPGSTTSLKLHSIRI